MITQPEYAVARGILIDYLLAKVAFSDWHGVSDAANDIRVLEAEENVRRANSGDSDKGQASI